MDKTLSIVIPCFNEEEAIPVMIPSLLAVKQELIKRYSFSFVEIIVVDDASSDRSKLFLSEIKDIEILTNEKNLGYGGALKLGFTRAKGQWICFLDMDNTYPVLALPLLFEKAVHTHSDHIVGVRSRSASGMSLTRGFGNWLFSKLTSFLFNNPTSDVCSGFRIFNRSILPLALATASNSLSYSLELSIGVTSSKFKTSELEIEYHPRRGSSKLSVWKDGWRFLFIIISRAFQFRILQRYFSTYE